MAKRFLLFSLPRCGSTTLMRIFNCHADINCSREPFNPDQSGLTHIGRVHDFATLDSVLAEVWAKHNGIKHVWHPSGWPFGNDFAYTLHLLSQPGVRVLFLNRRNQLQRLLSFEIALQTNIWHLPADGTARVPEQQLRPLDAAMLLAQLSLARDGVSRCLNHLRATGAEFTELWYEEFFGTDNGLPEKVVRLNEVLRSLGTRGFATGHEFSRVRELLDPVANRLTDERVYRSVPNICEIDARCGSDDSGWAFSEDR